MLQRSYLLSPLPAVLAVFLACLPAAAETTSTGAYPAQAGEAPVLVRPSLEACAEPAERELGQATDGTATLPPKEVRRRLQRAQLQLRRSQNLRAMLRCLMSRTK